MEKPPVLPSGVSESLKYEVNSLTEEGEEDIHFPGEQYNGNISNCNK